MGIRILAVFSIFLFSVTVRSQSNAIDPSFGAMGYAEDDKLLDRTTAAILRMSDSSIMLVGTIGGTLGTVSKFTKDGQLDKSFGYSGSYNYGLEDNSSVAFNGALMTRNAQLLITGTTFNYTKNMGGPFLYRVNTADGTPDSSFGINGLLMLDNVNAVQLDVFKMDSNENILMCFLQKSGTEGYNYNYSKLYKFSRNGVMDSAFLKRAYGRVNQTAATVIKDILITKDNHYWLAYRYANSGYISVEAYDSNGILYNAPVNGKIYYGLSSPYFLNSYKLLQASDTSFYTCINFGKTINWALNQYSGGVQFYHYNTKGELIRTFGKNGVITHVLSNKLSSGWDLFMQDNAGRIVFANNLQDSIIDGLRGYPIAIYNSSLYRFQTNGLLDSTFNDSGIFRDFKDRGADDGLRGLLICSDNRIIAAGFSIWDQKDASQFLCRFKAGEPFHRAGLPESSKAKITVFPMPFSDQLHIEGLEGTFQYSVYDLEGRLVREGIAEKGAIQSLGTLGKGVYLLRIISAKNEQLYFKIIKE